MFRFWLLLFASLTALPAPAVNFLVDTTTSAVDILPGDGQCRTAAGQCSLRAAILETNALAGADIIGFNIAPGGAQQINLVHTDGGGATSSLAITDALTIDGSTQQGFAGQPLIGVHCQNAFNGLIVAAPQVQIRHLAFTGFPQNGVRLDSQNASIQNVWFGMRPNGSLQANGLGVLVNGNGNRIEGARFAGNTQGGIRLSPLSAGTAVLDSFFAYGGFPAGQGCVAGSATLIEVSGDDQQVGPGNTIGGTGGDAVRFVGATNSRFTGNYVGTTAVNTATCLVAGSTVFSGGGNLVIADNVIAGLGGSGAVLDGVAGAFVHGNYFGLRVDLEPFGNGGDGLVADESTDIVVGSDPSGAPAPNAIGGNLGHGVRCLLSTLVLSNNTIGTDPGGSVDRGNLGDGLHATDCVGSSTRNLYYFNANGVALLGNATRIDNRQNSYRDNQQLAVDIGRDGPTPNDPGDVDLGPNLRLNVLEEGSFQGGELIFDEFPTSFQPGNYEARLHVAEVCAPLPTGMPFPQEAQLVGVTRFDVDPRAGQLRIPLPGEFPAYALEVRDLQNGVTSELSRCLRPAGGFLGDRVWRDLNRDGLQNEREPGIPGLLVSLLDASGAVLATRTTGVDGRYRFVNLASGNYRLRFALAPGHRHTTADAGDDKRDSDVVTPGGETALFAYTAGSVDASRDSGQVPEIHVNTFEGYSVQPPHGG